MTKFMWWTLVWFGLGLVENVINYHYSGGYTQYYAQYSEGIQGVAALLVFFLWLFLWHAIVQHEK